LVDSGDCGPRALQIGLQKLGIRADLERLRKVAGTGRRGTNLAGLEKAAAAYGIRAEGIQVNAAALRKTTPPAVAWVNGNHYLAVLEIEGDSVTVRDPNKEKEEVMEADEVIRRSGGVLLTLERR
jgi:ATP-binding cassette subfamily B protein